MPPFELNCMKGPLGNVGLMGVSIGWCDSELNLGVLLRHTLLIEILNFPTTAMENIILNKCYNIFGKDHRFLKLAFIIFALCLIVEEFYEFYVVKPTYYSLAKREMNVEDFPEIIICPDPSVNTTAVSLRGYDGNKEYFLGMGPSI